MGDSEDRTARHRVGDEAGLIEQARAGDQRAFAALVEPHRSMLTAVCYRIVGDEGAAEDALQETLVAAWRHLDRFQGRSKFSTWLYRLVVNACVDRARGRKHDAAGQDVVVLEHVAAATASQEDLFERRQTTAAVQQAVASLPARLRAAILLRYFEDLSYSDIAAVLNCSIGTVASRLNRGHRLLAKKLGPVRSAAARAE